MMTSSGHHNANWLNDDKCGYREMRLAAYFHQDGNTRRNRVIHRDGGKRIKPTKPIRRHIRPTRRKKLLQSSPHNAIALLLLELYVMTPTISSFTLPSAQLHIISNAASSKSSPSIIYSSFPQHDEYNDNNEQSNINPQFYRQNYNQLGVSSTTNNDRQRMIMNSINQNGGSGDDDEWESYLNLNFDGDGEVVIENDHVHAVQSSFDDGDLSLGRRKEVEAIDRTSIQEPKGEERSNSRSSMDQRDIYDVNANLRNGEQTPRQQLLQRNAAIAAQLRSKGNATNGESIAVDDRKEAIYRSGINGAVAKGIEGQVPPTNAKPMSARKSSDDVNGFRQQFITRTSEDSNEKDPATTPSTSTKRKRVTAEEIEYIKSTLPLTDVIETYNLKGFTRTNTHLAKACCPFHDDNNPSMSIDDNRGLYKCFACGAGGDVFNFIREYDYIENKRSGEDKMGYMQAVEYAAREFGDDRLVSGWNFGKSNDVMLYEGMSEEAKEKLIERQRKRDRIRQANTAAAAFYTKCLVTLSTAGKARAHLRSRNISPESVREFALGYAPDCYYGDEASSSKSWGEGSLVSYLAKMEFTPDEIVEAGLAVRTKKKIQTEDIEQQQPNNADAANDYSTLMDRFRSRLIVPILDDSGQHVIAFGGRHLESISTSEDAKSEQFTPSKYINSPESLVFVKKNVLFNKYKAQEALNARSSETNSSPSFTFHSHKGVVIVEGYFDAIALSNVGVKNVVASMGTALPPEQLLMAAEMGKVPGGRIILCMDGDEAGRNAVARLSSSSSILSKSSELNLNELYVATLPDEIKDPSDFVDYAGGGNKAKIRFEEDVLDKAISWNDWYIERIMSQYDTSAEDGTKGSFSGICDEVSTFLATLTNPADRTRRVYNIAEKLVELIAPSSGKNSTSSSMMRVQLEADILNMATRKAGVREAMERRIEQADGLSGEVTYATMEKLARGGTEEDNKLMSAGALARMKPPPKRVSAPNHRKPVAPMFGSTRSRTARKTTRQTVLPPERHYVPHFNGFRFEHKSDRDWLGLTDDRNHKMHLGSDSSPFLRTNQSASTKYKKQDVVYFNSNRYFGQQFITPEAIQAGYTFDDDGPSPDESIADFMDRKILTRDEDHMIEQAESRLLHALAKFPRARAAMMTVYSASTFGPKNMRWTSQERAWLFLCLTGSPEVDSVPTELLDGGTPSQLLSYLSQRPDCPVNAFGTKTTHPVSSGSTDFFGSEGIVDTMDESSIGSASPSETAILENGLHSILEQPLTDTAQGEKLEATQFGTLDVYFLDDDNLFPSFSNSKIGLETRAELTVQETVAALLRATAMKRFSTAKSALAEIVNEMDRRENNEPGGKDMLDVDDFGAMSSEELQELFMKVGSEVVSAQKSLYEAERSCDRVNSHLLDQSVSTGVQYKLSQASVERLNKMMDEHIASLPEDTHRPDTPGNDESYIFGSDEFDENIDSKYGGTRPDVFDPRLPTLPT